MHDSSGNMAVNLNFIYLHRNFVNRSFLLLNKKWNSLQVFTLNSQEGGFMQIPEVPRRGQLSIHGNVVNVLGNVNSTVGNLPRPINETIPIKLEWRLSYKHHYQFQNVRPKKVLAKYLVKAKFNHFRKIGLIILILEPVMLLQIKVMNRENTSVILTQTMVMLKYIQLILYLKFLFLKLLKDMIITPNN